MGATPIREEWVHGAANLVAKITSHSSVSGFADSHIDEIIAAGSGLPLACRSSSLPAEHASADLQPLERKYLNSNLVAAPPQTAHFVLKKKPLSAALRVFSDKCMSIH